MEKTSRNTFIFIRTGNAEFKERKVLMETDNTPKPRLVLKSLFNRCYFLVMLL